MLKRITAVILAFTLIALVYPLQTQAQTTEITPRYTHISSISANISYSGNTATCAVSVVGKPGTTNIAITMSIQRLESDGSYTTLHTWPEENKNSDTFSISKTRSVVRGYSYRTRATITVTRNGTTETTTITSGTVLCP